MQFLRTQYARRRGVTLVFTVVILGVLIGFTSLTIDVGYLYNSRTDLQNTADAVALAAARSLPDADEARAVAKQIVALNHPNDSAVLNDSDVRLGTWDAENGVFIEGGSNPDAVHIFVQKSQSNGNPLKLFFAGLVGLTQTDVSASAVAAVDRECFERGLTAGRYFNSKKIKMEKVDGDICIYGREGVDIEEIELIDGDADITIGALEDADIYIKKIKMGKKPKKKGKKPEDSVNFVSADYTPVQADRINDLIDEVEFGTFPTADLTVVVLSGPAKFGTKPGQTKPLPDTAYVVNGDATLEDRFKGANLVIAVRGTMTFKENVDLITTDPTGPGSIPLLILAETDVNIDHHAHITGGAIIAGRDVTIKDVLHNLPGENDFGLSIEAGRDIIIGKEFKLKKLEVDLEVPLFKPITSTLVQ